RARGAPRPQRARAGLDRVATRSLRDARGGIDARARAVAARPGLPAPGRRRAGAGRGARARRARRTLDRSHAGEGAAASARAAAAHPAPGLRRGPGPTRQLAARVLVPRCRAVGALADAAADGLAPRWDPA